MIFAEGIERGSYGYLELELVQARVSAHSTIGNLGLPRADLRGLVGRGRYAHALAFKEIVQPRLILAEHCFRGLRRPVYGAGNGEDFLVYSMRVPFDVAYDYEKQEKKIVSPPENCVFMVIARPVKEQTGAENVYGWINSWSWVLEDKALKGAPVNPSLRFDERLWSSGQS
jgi:hypothetical protein